MSDIYFIDAFEVRVVPKGWEHPKDADGNAIPLLPAEGFPESPEERRRWMIETGTPLPSRRYYMPDVGRRTVTMGPGEVHRTDIMAYETATEGTPFSPAFPNTIEGRRGFAAWCAANCPDEADALAEMVGVVAAR